VAPLAAWLLLVLVGTGALLWQQDRSRQAVTQRFDSGVSALGGFMANVAAQQLVLQRVQAQASLSDAVVEGPAFDRLVGGLGYSSGLLLDSRGRVIRNFPASPSLAGQEVAGRHAHLGAARQGQAVASSVFADHTGTSVIAFAVPFETASGRRVFSAAVPVRASPLASYFWWRYSSVAVEGTPWRLSATVRRSPSAGTTPQAAPSRSHRLPAMSRKTATRP
jgi:hypothetical protein